ncbi:MAG: hypothetical protein ACXU86_07820 [Archangium sp.]
MSLRRRLGAFAAGAALLLGPTVAFSQAGEAPDAAQGATPSDESYFLPFTERRFVIQKRILLPYAVLVDVPPPTPDASHFLGLNLGTLYGFADRWMLDATFAPLVLSKPFRYGNPELALAYQVVDSRPFELGVTVRAFLSTKGAVVGGLEPGVAVVLRAGSARLDVGAYAPLSTSGQPVGVLSVTREGFRVPVSASYQLNEHFHAAVNTGATFGELGKAGDSFALPLGVAAGFSTNVHGYWIDVLPFFSFPAFYEKAGVNTHAMSLGLILDFSKRI